MRKDILILLHFTVHMVLNLLKCSRNSKIILFIFKQLFKNFLESALYFCIILKILNFPRFVFKFYKFQKLLNMDCKLIVSSCAI